MSNQGKPKYKQIFNSKREPLFRCPFPDCGAVFAKEPNEPETCLKHRALIKDVMYILDHVGPDVKEEPAGKQEPVLFIPKPGMMDQAIQVALKNPKGG